MGAALQFRHTYQLQHYRQTQHLALKPKKGLLFARLSWVALGSVKKKTLLGGKVTALYSFCTLQFRGKNEQTHKLSKLALRQFSYPS